MSEQQVIEILQNFDGILNQNNMLSYIFRLLGWGIVKLLAGLVNGAEGLVSKMTGLTGFFNSPEITNLINSFKPVMFVMLGISLCYVAFQIFLNKKFEKRLVPTNIALAIIVIVLLPTGMIKLNELTQAGISVVYGQPKTMANEIIDKNITDVYLYDQSNFTTTDINPKNNVSADKINKIDITETIKKGKTNNEKVFENEVVYNKDGSFGLERIDGLFKWDVEYYRWDWNFWTIAITLATTAVTLILSSIKIGRLLYELAFNKVFAIIFAFTDIAHGQRLKKTIKNIISIFAVIFCMALMLKIYLLFSSWIISVQGLGIVSMVALIAASAAVIDGPNLVEQIFGIDAGLSSAWKTLAGTYAAGKTLSELTKGAKRAGQGLGSFMTSTGEKATVGGAGALGMASGIKENIKNSNLEKQMRQNENNKRNNSGIEPLENQMKKQGLGNIDEKGIDKNGSNVNNSIDTNANKNISSNGDNAINNKTNSSGENSLSNNTDNKAAGQGNISDRLDKKNTSDNEAKNKVIDDVKSNQNINSKTDMKDSLKQSLAQESTPGQVDKIDVANGNDGSSLGGASGFNDTSAAGLGVGDKIIDDGIGLGSASGFNDTSTNGLGVEDKIIDDGIGLGSASGFNDTSTNGLGVEDKVIDDGIGLSSGLGLNDIRLNDINMDRLGTGSRSSIDEASGNGEIRSSDDMASNNKFSDMNLGKNIGNEKLGTSNSNNDNIRDNNLNTSGINLDSMKDVIVDKPEAVKRNNIIETRTIGEYAKEKLDKSAIGNLNTKVKRSYQIGKNTTLRKDGKK